ncbi:unnamed protein product [Caenorhabditis brenneri]
MKIRTFPLPRLPVPAHQNVLRTLSIHELFGYSLLSKKCKMLIKSLKMVTTTAYVRIRTYISVLVTVRGSLQTLKFRFWPESHSVTLSLNFQPFEEFTKNDYDAKDYLQHVLSIFEFPKSGILYCFEEGSHYLDIDFLKETLGQKINASLVKHSGNFEFNKTIFREFVFRKVTLWTACFEENRIPPWILIQNFDRISVYRKALSFRIYSDDLTLMNSRIIQLRFFLITDIQLNRFIKMWQRGSNPHLEYISVRRQNNDGRNSRMIMNGIKYQKVPDEHVRRFQSVGCKGDLHGGLDFFRFDGTKATVEMRCNNNMFIFKMYVWWDHCIVN